MLSTHGFLSRKKKIYCGTLLALTWDLMYMYFSLFLKTILVGSHFNKQGVLSSHDDHMGLTDFKG